MLRRRNLIAAVLLAIIATTWSGQLSLAATSADLIAQRGRLQLGEAPHDARNVFAVWKQFVADKKNANVPQTRDVTVVGQIGGMPNVWPETHPDFPWYAGQASFFLVDSGVAKQFASHAKHHGGGECTFCRQLAAKNANAIAVVNLVDEQGEILKLDARELLELQERQTVIVRGTAKLLGGSLLVIDAKGIHVPR